MNNQLTPKESRITMPNKIKQLPGICKNTIVGTPVNLELFCLPEGNGVMCKWFVNVILYVLVLCCFLVATTTWADELPAPFTSYEITSSAGDGVNGTIYSWDVDSNVINGNIYAGQTQLSTLSSTISLKFDGPPGTLKLRCTNYAGGYSLLGSHRYYAWLTNGQFIDSWYSELDGASYAENSLSCRFDESGEHSLVLNLSMQKNASKYYVQGPRLSIHHIEWLPDYVDFDVNGKTVRINGDWIRQNVETNVLFDYKYDYSTVLNMHGSNGYTIIDSYIAGLSPTNSNSKFLANLHMSNDTVTITWTPNLDSRIYTIYGKTNLTDKAWHSPTNGASRFFKVGVEMR